MNDKKYVAIFVCSVLGMIICVWGLIWMLPPERYMDGEYPYWKQQKDAANKKGNEREILFLGDSRVKMDIRALQFADNAYNLSLGGGSPIEMYYTLRDYLTCHEAPQAVIIAFGPMHYSKVDVYENRDLYFHYLSKSDMDEANSLWLALDNKDFTKSSMQYEYRTPMVYMKPVIKSVITSRAAYNSDIYDKAAVEKGRMFGNDDKIKQQVHTPETKNKQFAPLNTLDYYMGRLLELCLAHDIPVYVEQLPMGNPGRHELEQSGYMAAYRDYMQSLAERYGVEVEMSIPLYPADEFQDDSHLNNAGAERFTAELREKYKDKLHLTNE